MVLWMLPKWILHWLSRFHKDTYFQLVYGCTVTETLTGGLLHPLVPVAVNV